MLQRALNTRNRDTRALS